MRLGYFSHIASAAMLLSVFYTAQAFEFNQGELSGSFDTTISLGATWRVEGRDKDLIGVANLGRLRSVNTDDGNINYDKGVVSSVIKVTHDLEVDYRNFGAFVRATYFNDFKNNGNNDLTSKAEGIVDNDFSFLDGYVRGSFKLGGRALDVRLGKQVVSWGESTFIQNSINVLNPVDVRRLRIPGSELREALTPVNMLWFSQELTDNLSFEAAILSNFDHVEIDPRGTYFSTNDFASAGGQYVVTGFGANDESRCALAFPGNAVCIPRAADRDARDTGQYGVAFRYLAQQLNDTEFGFFFVNYHSRVPIISAHAVSGATPNTADYFVEYPEDIQLYGLSFNTVMNNGIALQGEISHRDDVPLQIEDVEILLSALCSAASQLGACPGGLGSEVPGYIRRDVTQVQLTATKLIGGSNIFKANQWVLLGEVGWTYVHNMPDEDVLRLEGPNTPLPANPAVAGTAQDDGYADQSSWGYRLVTRLDYNSAIGAVNLSPRLAFAHDVNGTTPGPGGNFIEGRKALTLGLGASYLNAWTGDLSYTRLYGGGDHNLLHDRDFVSMNIKYSF
ncbi:MAG: DUF1302 domain-containing protein [Gammaproteobacteria bacterium]|nr:MAG: DUF1302 domain-containing protein [Gammaproteobacteria bacterium]